MPKDKEWYWHRNQLRGVMLSTAVWLIEQDGYEETARRLNAMLTDVLIQAKDEVEFLSLKKSNGYQ